MDEMTPPAAPAETSPQSGGTTRLFANMLNEYTHGKKPKKKHSKGFSPWMHMTKKKEGSYG